MKARFGLQGRFMVVLSVALLLLLLALTALWQRQEDRNEQAASARRQAVHDMVEQNLRRRGEDAAAQLADSLANPMYYLDMDAIAAASLAALRQPDVGYVLVYDEQGRVIDDGNAGSAAFAREMDDPLAFEAISARGLHTQQSREFLDISSPIMIGNQRLGGVRIGYDLASAHAAEARASAGLDERLRALSEQQALFFILFAIGIVVLFGVLFWLLQRSILGPLRKLDDTARAVEAGGFDSVVPESRRNDELGDVARAFAHMSANIARNDREIRRVAYTDALTGLANRTAFREVLDQRLLELGGSGGQLALLLADIDDFKRVNDTLGHSIGDEILLQFANRTREVVARLGGDDALLARFGGDEFVILLQSGAQHGADIRAKASELAGTLVAELARPVVAQERQVFLGASIGITLFPEDAGDVSSMMKSGDIAVYQAKVAGKNCHRFYSRAMDQAVERRVRLELELRDAWGRGELSLAYQPVYRLADGKLVGAEALLRWNHPEQGMVAPSVFIDIAEQSGLIEVIGPQVLRTACADTVRWQSEHRAASSMFVAVNVSPRQLRSGDLPEVVAQCLRDTGLPAASLHLELTETAVLGDQMHAGALLARLRNSGVKVWLDDFGTGFSGLSHLRRMPVDGVKIDRSFIADVLRDPDDLALTTAIIAMAHSLGITVVAEGVEKEGQYLILRERGCDLAQGFWLGHPINAQEFARLLV